LISLRVLDGVKSLMSCPRFLQRPEPSSPKNSPRPHEPPRRQKSPRNASRGSE
jgi:hypothetical protein